MNHQPFEDWLLDDEPLTKQQERELQIHLRHCTYCAGIAGSNLALHSTHMVSPAPGFARRFQPRLAAWRRTQVRRQALGTIILVLAGLAMLYVLAGPAMFEAVRSPGIWLGRITMYLVAVFTFLTVFGEVGGILLRSIPNLIPPAAWLILITSTGALGAIWMILMRRVARAPQGV